MTGKEKKTKNNSAMREITKLGFHGLNYSAVYNFSDDCVLL